MRYVHINSLSASEALEALALVMPPRSDVYVPPEGGLVVLQGSSETLDLAEELLIALDSSAPAKANSTRDKSLLEIFQELSTQMELTLVADPSLAEKRLYLDLREGDPEDLIKQIQRLVPVEVEVTAHTLVVGAPTVDGNERLKVYRLNYVDLEAAHDALSLLVNPEKSKWTKSGKAWLLGGHRCTVSGSGSFLN